MYNEIYLRTPDAVRFLGVSKVNFYKMVKDGVFKTARQERSRGMGGKPAWEIRRDELETVKAALEGRTKPIVVRQYKDVGVDAETRYKSEVKMKLRNVIRAAQLLVGCLEDLEKSI